MQSMHTYRAWTNKEGHALGRTQHLSTIEGTCLPQPEAALFPFESTGTADMRYIS